MHSVSKKGRLRSVSIYSKVSEQIVANTLPGEPASSISSSLWCTGWQRGTCAARNKFQNRCLGRPTSTLPRWESYVEFHRRFETRVSYNGSRELRMTRPHSGLNSRVKKQREYRDVTLTPPEEFDSNLKRWTIQDIRTTVRYPDGSVSDPRSLSDRTDTPGCFSNSRLGLLILSRPLPSDTILRGVWLAGFTEDKPRAAYGLST